jgi:(E)-4-hydroxy-3-methylbut-2-enyl-diphosphate synthase
LQEGIGDTIRYSLTPAPGEKRALEVEACKFLLQSLGFRDFQPLVTSCPWCGRTSSDRFQTLAKQVTDEIAVRLPVWRVKYPRCVRTKIAIMWCVVNGIGEASHADVGIFFPWNTEHPQIPVYVQGKMYKMLDDKNVFEQFMEIVEHYFSWTL